MTPKEEYTKEGITVLCVRSKAAVVGDAVVFCAGCVMHVMSGDECRKEDSCRLGRHVILVPAECIQLTEGELME